MLCGCWSWHRDKKKLRATLANLHPHLLVALDNLFWVSLPEQGLDQMYTMGLFQLQSFCHSVNCKWAEFSSKNKKAVIGTCSLAQTIVNTFITWMLKAMGNIFSFFLARTVNLLPAFCSGRNLLDFEWFGIHLKGVCFFQGRPVRAAVLYRCLLLHTPWWSLIKPTWLNGIQIKEINKKWVQNILLGENI